MADSPQPLRGLLAALGLQPLEPGNLFEDPDTAPSSQEKVEAWLRGTAAAGLSTGVRSSGRMKASAIVHKDAKSFQDDMNEVIDQQGKLGAIAESPLEALVLDKPVPDLPRESAANIIAADRRSRPIVFPQALEESQWKQKSLLERAALNQTGISEALKDVMAKFDLTSLRDDALSELHESFRDPYIVNARSAADKIRTKYEDVLASIQSLAARAQAIMGSRSAILNLSGRGKIEELAAQLSDLQTSVEQRLQLLEDPAWQQQAEDLAKRSQLMKMMKLSVDNFTSIFEKAQKLARNSRTLGDVDKSLREYNAFRSVCNMHKLMETLEQRMPELAARAGAGTALGALPANGYLRKAANSELFEIIRDLAMQADPELATQYKKAMQFRESSLQRIMAETEAKFPGEQLNSDAATRFKSDAVTKMGQNIRTILDNLYATQPLVSGGPVEVALAQLESELQTFRSALVGPMAVLDQHLKSGAGLG